MIDVVIRDGVPTDIPSLYILIKELAVYEKSENQVIITEEQLLKDGFRASTQDNPELAVAPSNPESDPLFRFIVAEADNQCIGIALFYQKYSTWTGSCFYLEDLIVSEKHRGKGVGKRLLDRLIEITKDESKSRLEWQVLDWNESAISFYKKYEAELDSQWINVRLRF